MVALSPRCCADLGIELSDEDAKKPYVEVSGRKGLGVKADDLMDKLIETALKKSPRGIRKTTRRAARRRHRNRHGRAALLPAEVHPQPP
jgi:hypothetical protein